MKKLNGPSHNTRNRSTTTSVYRFFAVISVAIVTLYSCSTPADSKDAKTSGLPIQGTWKLLTGTLVDKDSTTVTDYTKGKEFIKIINNDHFAFLLHDLSKGKNADSVFSSGGGHYTLKDSSYTENLEYCNDRQWEGNSFSFKVTINNDTLIQTGVEKIDSIGVNRVNTEKYIRLKD